jgi:hypothetical protein
MTTFSKMCHPESFLNFFHAPEFDMKVEASTDRRWMTVTRHTQVTACLFSRHLKAQVKYGGRSPSLLGLHVT